MDGRIRGVLFGDGAVGKNAARDSGVRKSFLSQFDLGGDDHLRFACRRYSVARQPQVDVVIAFDFWFRWTGVLL